MTSRLKGVAVTFGEDIREDDAEAIINALRMIKGVLHVEPIKSTYEDDMVRARVDHEWRNKLLDLIRPKGGAA